MSDEIYAKVFDHVGVAMERARKAMVIASASVILSVVAIVVAIWG